MARSMCKAAEEVFFCVHHWQYYPPSSLAGYLIPSGFRTYAPSTTPNFRTFTGSIPRHHSQDYIKPSKVFPYGHGKSVSQFCHCPDGPNSCSCSETPAPGKPDEEPLLFPIFSRLCAAPISTWLKHTQLAPSVQKPHLSSSGKLPSLPSLPFCVERWTGGLNPISMTSREFDCRGLWAGSGSRRRCASTAGGWPFRLSPAEGENPPVFDSVGEV